MSDIKYWSETAASNNAAAPNGWPESMAPSAVNNTARETHAAIRKFYANLEWREFGDATGTNDCHTIAYASGTTFTTATGDGDTTAIYHKGRRIRAVGSVTTTIYGVIVSSTHSSQTTVTVAWDDGALSSEDLTISLGLSLTGGAIPGQRSILDYDADCGNGTVDASVPAQAYLDAIVAAGEGEMYLPAGEYNWPTQVTASTSAQEIVIRGDGVGLTRIVVPDSNAAGAISVVLSDYTSEITVRDLSIMGDGEACGTALEITQPVGGNRHNRTVFMTRVHIGGVDPDTDYFDTCCNLTGCWRPLIDGCVFGGPFSATAYGTYADSAQCYKTAVALDLDDSYHPELKNSYVWSANVGISNVSTGGGNEAEGLRISNSNIVLVRTGVKYARTAQEPTFWLTDCHVNARDRGLDINGCKLIVIKGNSFYNVDLDETHYGTPADISLDDTSGVIITSNTFHFDGPTDRINIQLVASTAADDILIANNLFNCVAANAVWIGSSATNVSVVNNLFPGTYTKNVSSASGTTVIANEDGNSAYKLESQAANDAAGPEFTLYRDSATPAVSDSIGQVSFAGNSSAGTRRDYGAIKAVINDETDATENATIQFFVMRAGTLSNAFSIDSNESATSGDTSLLIYDVDNGSVGRVTVGAADSGGSGYKVLRILN